MVFFTHIYFFNIIQKTTKIHKFSLDSIVSDRIIYFRNDPLTPAESERTRLSAFKVRETKKNS